jgi:hypothetical protein
MDRTWRLASADKQLTARRHTSCVPARTSRGLADSPMETHSAPGLGQPDLAQTRTGCAETRISLVAAHRARAADLVE